MSLFPKTSTKEAKTAFIEIAVDNILATYQACETDPTFTEKQYEEASKWYVDANQIVMELADDFEEIQVATIAGVVAAISPGTSWTQNVREARMIIEAFSIGRPTPMKPSTYPANYAKALRILRENRSDVEAVALLVYGSVGLKVRSFFYNLMARNTEVTVDRHAAKVALGISCGGAVSMTANQYNLVKQAYVIAADRVGIPPSQLQAICWVYYKHTFERASPMIEEAPF